MAKLNHTLYFLVTQVNKFFFGFQHIADAFAYTMHKIVNMLTDMAESKIEQWKAERHIEKCA